ncbi:hypothetical protein ACLOJK_015784 [Asimina triloba]
MLKRLHCSATQRSGTAVPTNYINAGLRKNLPLHNVFGNTKKETIMIVDEEFGSKWTTCFWNIQFNLLKQLTHRPCSKWLLRNRVSAQQARERKKVYVNDLESKAGELQDKNAKLEEKILTLINENTMLRKVLMNTRPKVDESAEPQNDQ